MFRLFNFGFDVTTKVYGSVVGWLMRLSVIVLIVYTGLLYLTAESFARLPGGFIPQQDQGYLIVNVQLPDGASVPRTEAVMEKITKIASKIPGVAHVTANTGYSIFASANISNSGGAYLTLAPFAERKGKIHADQVIAQANKEFAAIEEAQVSCFGAPPILGLGNAGGFKLQVQDRGNLGLEALEGLTQNLIEAAAREPGIAGTFSSFRSGNPQIYIDIDRERVSKLGLSVQAVNEALQTYLGSIYVNDVTLFGRNFQVNIQADRQFRQTQDDLQQIKIRNPQGEMIPIASVLQIRNVDGPSKVNRFQMYPAADVNGFNIPQLLSSAEALSKMEALAERELPKELGIAWTDLAFQQKEAANTAISIAGVFEFRGDTTLLIFGLSVLFVFLVLSAQYESWLLPLAIVLIVPMCLLCAALGLHFTQLDLNIFTQIGLVVLVGLACKNAILIVEFAKQKREAGENRFDAGRNASIQRLRPILMTSAAFILGVLPLVTAEGAGQEMRRALGTAVFSGMIGVTVFGIFLTPVFYYVIDYFRRDQQSKSKTSTIDHTKTDAMVNA